MNTLFFIIIVLPILEIALMIKIGEQIGALNTILMIMLTAAVGIFYARIEGLNTLKSGLLNIYRNKIPFYEIISGASIAIAAIFLILPGFITDAIGFLLLFPFTRRLIIGHWVANKQNQNVSREEEIIDAEIIEDTKEKDKDEL
ncbi:MAG: FxsA family protein [Pelagibacteraceae bacterium]|jgi:UPF0716 protein FxsA